MWYCRYEVCSSGVLAPTRIVDSVLQGCLEAQKTSCLFSNQFCTLWSIKVSKAGDSSFPQLTGPKWLIPTSPQVPQVPQEVIPKILHDKKLPNGKF